MTPSADSFILLILLSLPRLQMLWNVAELVMLTSSCHDIIWLINHHLTAFQIIKAAGVFALLEKNNPTVSDVWWPISKLVYFQNPLKAVIHQLLQIVGGNIFSKFQLQAETALLKLLMILLHSEVKTFVSCSTCLQPCWSGCSSLLLSNAFLHFIKAILQNSY